MLATCYNSYTCANLVLNLLSSTFKNRTYYVSVASIDQTISTLAILAVNLKVATSKYLQVLVHKYSSICIQVLDLVLKYKYKHIEINSLSKVQVLLLKYKHVAMSRF